MHSLKLVEKLLENKEKESFQKELTKTWSNVWLDDTDKRYSRLRLHKTKDKIETLEKLGVDFHKKRVLDIGCGDGTTLFYLSDEYNITGTGIDISADVIQGLNTELLQRYPNLNFIVGDHRYIDISDNQYDIVLSWGVVEHFKEYSQALMEAKRVLKKGGYLILIQPHGLSFGVLQKLFLQFSGKWKFGPQKDFSHRELRKILDSLGYTIKEVYTKAPYKDMPITHYLDNIVKRFYRNWGHYLYIVAKK